MKFADIPGEHLTFKMLQTYAGNEKLRECPVSRVSQSTTSLGEYELYTSKTVIMAKARDERQISRLDMELSTDPAYLAQLVDIDAGGGFTLEIVFFAKGALEMGKQDIGVDEYVAERMGIIRGRRGRQIVDDKFCESLSREFCYKRGDDFYFFTLVGPSIEDELGLHPDVAMYEEDDEELAGTPQEDEGENEDMPENHQGLVFSKEASFCVVSTNASFVATEKSVSKGGTIYVATKMHRRKSDVDKAVRLAHGQLNFCDWTAAGQVQLLAKYQLADIVQENSSYLKTWDDFGNIEGEILLREAREFGVIYYSNVMENHGGTATVTINVLQSVS